jgi:hypothetical protein
MVSALKGIALAVIVAAAVCVPIVRLDHVASVIVNAIHGMVGTTVNLALPIALLIVLALT